MVRVGDVGTSLVEKKIWIRGRLHTSRAKGKQCFFLLRQQQFSVQCLLAVGETVSKAFVKFVAGYTKDFLNQSCIAFLIYLSLHSVSKESVIDVEGVVVKAPQKIEGATQHDVEIHVTSLWVVSAAEPRLPLQIEDASRPIAEEVC